MTALDTPRRILDAAADEFAERGLAGARVDRIAELAVANKQRIYAYFGSKDQLFDQVVQDRIEQLVDAVPFDAADLPGYAVRLWEFNVGHPSLVRLLLWHALERPGEQLAHSVSSHARKVAALQAVRHGSRDDDWPADRLLGQVLALVHGVTLAPGPDPEQVRADLHRAVARLVG